MPRHTSKSHPRTEFARISGDLAASALFGGKVAMEVSFEAEKNRSRGSCRCVSGKRRRDLKACQRLTFIALGATLSTFHRLLGSVSAAVAPN